MDQDLSSPTDESPYDNAGGGNLGRNTEEHAYDNATFEEDTGEQTAVDMPPPSNEPVNDISAEDEIAANMDTEPSSVIDVNAVDGDEDAVDDEDEKDVETPDDEEIPVYSYVDTNKLKEESRYDSIKLKTTDMSDEELHRRKQKSIKICIGLFVFVLIAVIVGLLGFYIDLSTKEITTTTPRPTTKQPLIEIDYIGAEVVVTFNNRNYTDALNDSTSSEYQALVDEISMLEFNVSPRSEIS
ncbi:uncharacterized protein LOC135155242 [Lytechinus pictus]|uniref:uncharacterized protein LOC135155242 n=1 Tax=Lytechinus pictus TaxID=7653 RepID=UPI0030B9E138